MVGNFVPVCGVFYLCYSRLQPFFFYVKFMYYILILKGCVSNLVTSFWD